MGTKGRQIIDLDVKKVVDALRRAYADEWLAMQGYLFMAQTVSGKPAAKAIEEALEEIAGEEKEHQEELAERLASLGAQPPKTFSEITRITNTGFPDLPKDAADLEAIIGVVLEAEAGAIGVYDKLVRMTHGKDALTYQLAVHILGEEVEHEDEFEQLTK